MVYLIQVIVGVMCNGNNMCAFIVLLFLGVLKTAQPIHKYYFSICCANIIMNLRKQNKRQVLSMISPAKFHSNFPFGCRQFCDK